MQWAAAFDSLSPGCSDSTQRLKLAVRVLETTHELTS
jgi:hypothetical protein